MERTQYFRHSFTVGSGKNIDLLKEKPVMRDEGSQIIMVNESTSIPNIQSIFKHMCISTSHCPIIIGSHAVGPCA
jgi:hypothetical protein